MTYREPAPRKSRLWYVMVFGEVENRAALAYGWFWAIESDSAIALLVKRAAIARVQSSQAVCGEDFAEQEAAGPPKESEEG